MPVFNAEEGLEASLQSLLSQTLKGLEIIVVNDASTDGSAEVIDRLSSENVNIIAIHFLENQGVHEARLAGIKKASAPWIGFLDADDFARPSMFETMLRAANQQDVDIVVCGSYRVTPERQPIAAKLGFKSSEKVDSDVFGKFCRFDFGSGMLWNKLYRREVISPFADMHFPWRQNINEDLLLNIGCFYKARSVYLTDEILHEYVLSESGVTSTSNNARAYVDTYRAYALAVSIFGEFGSSTVEKIIDMYRTQLSWRTYLISDVSEIVVHADRLKEATDLIYHTCPIALACLPARQRPSQSGTRRSVKTLVKKCLSAAGLYPALTKR